MALDFYRNRGIKTQGIIHHSDPGIQYASKEYTKKLLENQARISMTQTGDPLHNALAERMNNTIRTDGCTIVHRWTLNKQERGLTEPFILIIGCVRIKQST